MFAWLEGPGKVFRDPLPESTNYLCAYDKSGRLIRSGKDAAASKASAESPDLETSEDRVDQPLEALRDEELPRESDEDLRPFPLNQTFKSQSVLSEEAREAIYRMVALEGQSIRNASAWFKVDMNRVGAVVRLKTIEKQWDKQGKCLARPYAKAVLSMLPVTPYDLQNPAKHESINDLAVHQYTKQQLFWPTSESRPFTRSDAAAAFDATLLPADGRIPHPELVRVEKDRLSGIKAPERVEREAERLQAERERKETLKQARSAEEQRQTKVVSGQRWDFRFKNVNVQDVGDDGRATTGVGWRYGAPHMDRKIGLAKIPTSVT